MGLEQAGFGVLLPTWWTRKGTRGRLTVKAVVSTPKMKSESGLGLDELVKFDWEVALGGNVLTRAELEELARLKTPLVRVRGQWVHVSAQEIEAALRFWKEKGRTATVRDVVRLALGAPGLAPDPAFEGVEATGWLGDLLAPARKARPRSRSSRRRPGCTARCAPTRCAATPGSRSSAAGASAPASPTTWAWARRSRRWPCIERELDGGPTTGPTLLICPTSVVGNWQREAARFTPDLPVLVHHGAGDARRQRFTGRGGAPRARPLELRAAAPRPRGVQGGRLGGAWSSTRPRTSRTRRPSRRRPRARCTRRLPHRADRHAGREPRRRPVVDHGVPQPRLPRHARPSSSARSSCPSRPRATPTRRRGCKRLTGPFILRRLKTDRAIIADLPEKLEMKVFCTLTKEQASLYAGGGGGDAGRALERRPRASSARASILATLVQAQAGLQPPGPVPRRQLAAARPLGQARAPDRDARGGARGGRPRARLHAVRRDGRACCSSTSQETFGREVLFLHGGVPEGQRDRMVERFQKRRRRPARLHPVAQGRRHRPEPDRARTTSSTSTAGGTRPSRTRPPTAPSASARRATCRSTSSSASARWRRRSTR